MKQLLISIFQSNSRFKALLAVLLVIIVSVLVVFQTVILPTVTEKFYKPHEMANHEGTMWTLIALSQHLNHLFTMHSDTLTKVSIRSSSKDSIHNYLNRIKKLPGTKNVYCLLNGSELITPDGTQLGRSFVDSLKDLRIKFESYEIGGNLHPKKFHNYIMNKIRFTNLNVGTDTLRLIISALDSTGERFKIVNKEDFDPSMIKYLIVLEIDEVWLRKEVPNYLEQEFYDNEIFALWSNVDSTDEVENHGAGVLAFGDTLWWFGRRSVETAVLAKGLTQDWVWTGHPWFHYRTLTEWQDDSLNETRKELDRYKATFWLINILSAVISLSIILILILIRKQWLANQIALSHLAHSIKTPVSRIRLDTDSLLEDMVASPDEEREIIRAISHESSRMELAVQSAALSLQSGKRVYNFESNDLAEIVSETAEAWRANFDHAKVRLITNKFDGAIEGELDREMIAVMIDNLLDNALRHTVLNLDNLERDSTSVTVELRKSDVSVEIVVDDMGGGIPVKERKQVFSQFRKSKVDAATGATGLGLGLALVKEVAEAHGGSVSIDDNDVGGTTITVEVKV